MNFNQAPSVKAVFPHALAQTKPTDVVGSVESLEEAINEIEASMLQRLESLRGRLREQQRMLEDVCSSDKDRETAAILAIEKRRIAEERVKEKAHIHTAMQQLTEAWLRLESEEKRVVSTPPLTRDQPAEEPGNSGNGENWIWYGGESNAPNIEKHQDVPPSFIDRKTDPPPMACAVGTDASQAANLFFKLRSDMRKYAGK
jgi:hypothetical protein